MNVDSSTEKETCCGLWVYIQGLDKRAFLPLAIGGAKLAVPGTTTWVLPTTRQCKTP